MKRNKKNAKTKDAKFLLMMERKKARKQRFWMKYLFFNQGFLAQ